MKKGRITNWILILIFITGLSLLLYPSFSDYWNAKVSTYAVASYVQQVATMDDDRYGTIWQEARAFNAALQERNNPFYLPEELAELYPQRLSPGDTGIMGYVEIPKINVLLPIYHGTDESVLQVAVGHLEWTSLPTGGESTHCVLSGHRGLPSARLFTDLDQMEVGDTFRLNILDEVLTYEVDQILIVLPEECDELLVQEGKDLCTLTTCTPYGINSHRMLIRGHRVENEEIHYVKTHRITADATLVQPELVAIGLAIPMLLVLFVYLMLPRRKKP